MNKALVSCLCFLLLPLVAGDAAAEVRTGKGLSPVLDGKTFIVAVAPLNNYTTDIIGSSFAFADSRSELFRPEDLSGDRLVLVFSSGRIQFDSQHCPGCKDGVYRSTAAGDSVRFEGDTGGRGGANISWRGTLRGQNLYGTAVFTSPAGKRADYTFYGRAAE